VRSPVAAFGTWLAPSRLADSLGRPDRSAVTATTKNCRPRQHVLRQSDSVTHRHREHRPPPRIRVGTASPSTSIRVVSPTMFTSRAVLCDVSRRTPVLVGRPQRLPPLGTTPLPNRSGREAVAVARGNPETPAKPVGRHWPIRSYERQVNGSVGGNCGKPLSDIK
jgi:hypothetical protein